MFTIKLDFMLFLLLFGVSSCERRIKDGVELVSDKKYVVYFLKGEISSVVYDSWLCGGALVSKDFIVTSAACVDDVKYLYAIAGYKKYVSDADIENDECTKQKKKKVVYTCTPISFQLEYDKLSKWSYIDIALAKVESPYDFNDVSYEKICSYIPAPILINYDTKFQEAGTDAMVLGWGHDKIWRKPGDNTNYNQATIRYASCILEDKEICKHQYEAYPNMSNVIDRYMICSREKGNINELGQMIIDEVPLTIDGCANKQHDQSVQCRDYQNEYYLIDNTRRKLNSSRTNNSTIYVKNTADSTTRKNNVKYVNGTNVINMFDYKNMSKNSSRRQGICQNDHGGPLVTWMGSKEVLIGVASVFRVSASYECIGPYLYTSTQCNGAFLDCVLTNGENFRRSRGLCNKPAIERGFDKVERDISWIDHPAGPADNENHEKSEPESDLNKENEGLSIKPGDSAKFGAEERPGVENDKSIKKETNLSLESYAEPNTFTATMTYPSFDSPNEKYLSDEKYFAHDIFTTTVTYPLLDSSNERNKPVEKDLAHDIFTATVTYPPFDSSNEKNPSAEKDLEHDIFTATVTYPPFDSSHEKIPLVEKDLVRDIFTENYAANEKYTTNEKYAPVVKLHVSNQKFTMIKNDKDEFFVRPQRPL